MDDDEYVNGADENNGVGVPPRWLSKSESSTTGGGSC